MSIVGTTQSEEQGDVQLIATDRAVGLSTGQAVSVIVPAQIATPHPEPNQAVTGQNLVMSSCTSPVAAGIGNNVALATTYNIPMSITVWDQFQKLVDDLYLNAFISETNNGTNVYLNQNLAMGGTYTDPFGETIFYLNNVSPGDPHVASWLSQPLLPFQTGTDTFGSIAVQVDGFPIGYITDRSFNATSPPNTISVTWP